MTYIICYAWNGPAIYRVVRVNRACWYVFIAEFGADTASARLADAVCRDLNRAAA